MLLQKSNGYIDALPRIVARLPFERQRTWVLAAAKAPLVVSEELRAPNPLLLNVAP